MIRIGKVDLQNEDISAAPTRRDFSLQSMKSKDRDLNAAFSWALGVTNASEPIVRSVSTSTSTTTGELIEFDVFERDGFDQIMATVGHTARDEDDKFARCLRDTLELVGGMTSTW